MLQLPRWRVILVIIVTVLGFTFTLPNLLPPAARQHLPSFLKPMNLGLDLQGGSHLLLEVDTNAMKRQQLDNLAEQMASTLREATPRILYTGRGVASDTARVTLVDPNQMSNALRVLGVLTQNTSGTAETVTLAQGATPGLIEARMTDAGLRQLSRQAAEQSIEVIRRRIDPNGTSEVSIVRQGDNRIVVQAPGVSDPEMLKQRIGQTALMTFNLVREGVSPGETLPPGTLVARPYPGVGNETVVVQRRPEFTGEHLRHAGPSTDSQTGQFVLTFSLDSQGTRIFCRVSREHTGHRFAILLDNQVLTAPVINEPICGGSGQISGSFDAQSASNLAIMLNAGALPAPLTVIEQRSVGATLGQEAIRDGSTATLYSSIAVVVFMGLAYGLFGLMAILALIVNMTMIIGAMSIGGATLTLPGIAGLVLTIGMAVDANVLIYERMREEQRHGRSAAMSIDSGFSRAMVTIIDSHLTQFIAALILFNFGEGPVKGFAWTLSIGCITSVITATFVTQTLVAIWFRITRPKHLPI
jgi:protein-export membrane protein SecD